VAEPFSDLNKKTTFKGSQAEGKRSKKTGSRRS